jgi:hypothetical protein
MVEHMVVVHVVAGSNPVIHPKFYKTLFKKGSESFLLSHSYLGQFG